MDIITDAKYQCDVCHNEYDYDHFDVCKDKQTCYDCLSHYLKKKLMMVFTI